MERSAFFGPITPKKNVAEASPFFSAALSVTIPGATAEQDAASNKTEEMLAI